MNANEDYDPTLGLDYSHSIYPLIVISGVVTTILTMSVIGMIQEILNSGVLVWYRDNLGMILSHLIFHAFLLKTLFSLQNYILSKERRQWGVDISNDGHMDFFEAFMPMFIFISLYLFKLMCIRTEYTFLKVTTCFSLILVTIIGESHFDRR